MAAARTPRPPVSQPVADEHFQIDWRPAVAGLKRFWYVAVLVGLPLGAGGAYAAWIYIPAPYVASAELYMRSYVDRVAFSTSEQQASFRTRKQTNQKLLRSREVLTAALRNAEVANTPTLQEVPDPVVHLQKHLSVGSPGAEFISVGLSGEHAEDLPVIINGVVDAYMKEVVVGSMDDREGKLANLRQVLATAEDALDLKRKQYQQFVEASQGGVASTIMAEQRHAGLQELRTMLRGEVTRTELELIRERAKQSYRDSVDDEFELGDEQLAALVADLPEYKQAEEVARAAETYVGKLERSKGADSTSPTLATARAEATRRQAELKELQVSLRPHVKEQLKNSWEAQGEAGDQKLSETIAQLESFRNNLRQQLEENQIEERQAGKESVGLRRLEAELLRKEELVNLLATEAERREFEISNATPPIAVQEDAVVPRTRNDGKRIKTAVLVGGGGVGFGMALAAGLGFLFTSVQRTQDLKGNLAIDLFGTLPHLPRGGAGAGAGQRGSDWNEALKESVDAARVVLLRKLGDGRGQTPESRLDAGGRVVLISSAVASEGKTTLSCHLAASLARTGRRVVLVDADLRRPSTHRVFGCESGPGLSDVLRGEKSAEEVEIPLHGSELRLIPAGDVCDTALAGFGTAAMAECLDDLRARYDIVIVDSPPALPVSDGLMLAEHVDGVMFAVRRGVTRLRNVAAALERFQAVGVPVLGAVAIGMDDEVGRYGYAPGRYPYAKHRQARLLERTPAQAAKI
ncbi:polysaccharide biosynthesis tyrosine autokinase [Alienimonas californiensis]|uniref:Tyrosine-protein kinase wzc n=1 Tax=Alienimonas californiensis TaxID=2527989 RepID=A0A517P477_9PLAN|nr:polysaccharide biosynthesis tyrosine autokinase [Alienimonas californiensis]QDT14194.1 Tyrosine-protein kinase wzc [Alienimonas californiensis]